MSKLSDRLPPDWIALARVSSTALDLSFPPPGRPPPGVRSVLAFGRPPEDVVNLLRRPPFSLTIAIDLQDYVWLLASRKFDAIVSMPDDPGIHALRMLKLEDEEPSVRAEHHFAAIALNRDTPYFLLPQPGELEFAMVIAPPELVYFYRLSKVSLESAILYVDVPALLRGPPS